MKKTEKYRLPILAIAILYFFLYNPILKPGIALGGTILMMVSFVYMLLHFAEVERHMKNYKVGLFLGVFIILYILFICFVNGEDISEVKQLFFWLIISTIVPVFLVNEVFVRYREIAFWDLILEAGFIASMISCIALFYPPFNDFLRNIQVEPNVTSDALEEQLDFRSFGLAFYLTSCYGYVQGLLASLCLLRLDKEHKRYAFYFLTMFLSVVVNARTGLFPIVITLIYLIIRSVVKIKILTLFKIAIAGTLGTFLIIQVFNKLPDVTDFFMDFIDQLSFMFVEGEVKDSYYIERLFFPNSLSSLVFGEGHDVSTAVNNSDIGFVNQVFLGGIIFAGALLLYEFIIYRKIVKWSNDFIWPTIFLLSLLVFNYKGAELQDASSSFVRLWILYFYVLAHNQLHPEKNIKIT